jgi:hypothetical protein
MSKISKFVKVDKNVLLEYVYDDQNNISESYDVLVNSKDILSSYLAPQTSGTYNTIDNSLFRLDRQTNKYAKINPSNYSFLQIRNFSTSLPIRHDTVRVHLPINWTFGEYLGFYIRVFAYDTVNEKTYDLSNFYFDMTDTSQSYLLNYTAPPLLFQEKLWGKNITLNIPAVSAISAQRTGNLPKENSINANLTNGAGLSMTSPIFIDFHFIRNIQTVNAITSYTLTPKVTTTVSQTPEFESLGLKIEHSINGDFFEVYGTYNGTLGEFNQFINDSVNTGHRYYVQYNITTYEQNIRGKTLTSIVSENFGETIEFRPIIKTSTTTAIIDVEMRLIDAVDDSYIIRRASYGMLQDEVSRYSLSLIKINLKSATKPKIYNIKNSVDPSLVGVSNAMGRIMTQNMRPPRPASLPSPPSAGSATVQYIYIDPTTGQPLPPGSTLLPSSGLASSTGLVSNAGGSGQLPAAASNNPLIETIKVPFPVLVEKNNVMCKADPAVIKGESYFPEGQCVINIKPFDNIFKFSIATGKSQSPEFFNLSGFNEIKFVIKNDTTEVSFPLFTAAGAGSIDLSQGQVAFKITESKFQDVKKVFKSGVNIFYIVGTSQTSTFPIYSGLFKIFDSPESLAELNTTANNLIKPVAPVTQPSIILDSAVSGQVQQVNFNKPKSPITKETLPKGKPLSNQNLIDKLKGKDGGAFGKFTNG